MELENSRVSHEFRPCARVGISRGKHTHLYNQNAEMAVEKVMLPHCGYGVSREI